MSLDASRPWILYWCLQGVDLLEELPSDHYRCRMVSTLEHCWSSFGLIHHPVTKDEDPLYYSAGDEVLLAGGFGGGPSQMPHAATTYAAILALCILVTSGGESAHHAKTFLQTIRLPLYRWMVTLLDQETGAYRMHTDGEIDIRASYTILCCATLLGIASPILCQNKVVEFIQSCQTFEGGLGGEPWSEAHGGYAFCGVAALQILGKLHVLDLPALTGWLARRQMSFEGGFSGRSNKLVDGCYSFWQGGKYSKVTIDRILAGIHSRVSFHKLPWQSRVRCTLLMTAPLRIASFLIPRCWNDIFCYVPRISMEAYATNQAKVEIFTILATI